MIHLVTKRASKAQFDEMLATLGLYIKVAVDIRHDILAGGGELHADCEFVLLENGSQPTDIWGADWVPRTQEVRYESLINLKPRQNRSMEILEPGVRYRVESIVRTLLEDL